MFLIVVFSFFLQIVFDILQKYEKLNFNGASKRTGNHGIVRAPTNGLTRAELQVNNTHFFSHFFEVM